MGATGNSTISRDLKAAAVYAVLESETFSRSEQLRSLLRYVCEMEIEGRAATITEYLIGVEALGRPSDFSPLQDSSVRSRAWELRQRLKKYYEREGKDSGVRIEFHRGSYVPHFTWTETASQPEPDPEPEPLISAPQRDSRFKLVAAFFGGALLAGLIGWIAVKAQYSVRAADPILRQAWTPLLTKDPDVLVTIATPLHLLISPYMNATPIDLPKYPAPNELYALFSRYRPLPPGATLEMQPVQKALAMGDVQAVSRTVATLAGFGVPARILPETNSPLQAIRKRSAILFGSPWYSRAATVVLENAPWTFRQDPNTKEIGIFGRGLKAGSKYLPRHDAQGNYQEVFGLLTVLPSDENADDGRTLVVFSGLTSVGINGAASFFSSPQSMRDFAVRLSKEGVAQFPRSYQVLLRCRASEDAQLLSYSYEAHQVLK
jgi:hypothetical protein